jgi:cytochrome c553
MRIKHIADAAALLLLAAAAQAQDSQALYNRGLAATCAACHGTDGAAAPGSSTTALAGMPADYLKAQMKAFKAGTRPATVMHQLAKGYSDAQIEQLAAYFSAQKK